MEVTVLTPETAPPCERCCAVSMIIKSFKGRRDVEVHLFRPVGNEEEKRYDWSKLVGPLLPEAPCPPESSRKVILESFTVRERDRIINYLKEQYATRLKALRSRPLEFPVPGGLPALSDLDESKSIGLIRFERIPSYSLDIPLHGLYDLSQHPPIVDAVDAADAKDAVEE
ncbi:hypothetical protein [Paucidesulfovibrio longus]|uniref:hypothetical protein n=1 Tax=Paucidesulfovibrio longus TaxID=889 RepID=UPI0003B572C6|nr:hypothetical protein [Paucidesulfovibrio longus]